MKLSKDFVLRQIVDTWVVVPVGAAAEDFHGMIQLNESGAALWQALERGATVQELTQQLLSEYAVTESQAQADVDAFLHKLSQAGCLI